MHEEHGLSIWFFVGVILTLYGIIILIANIISLVSPVETHHVVLARLHAGFWWSFVLLILGVLFLILHWPARNHSVLDDKDHKTIS